MSAAAFFQSIGSFFTHLIPGGAKPVSPSSFQDAVNKLGVLIDQAETIVTNLQALAPLLPPQFGAVAAPFVLGVHTLDSWVDTLETPAAAPPAPPVAAPPVTPAPTS